MNKTTVYLCPNQCCTIKISPYKHTPRIYSNTPQKKAGALIKDPSTNKILLVQSKGNLWGIPKGTANLNEEMPLCAIREVQEETGIILSVENFLDSCNIFNKGTYFYTELPECNVEIQHTIIDNDANGITWINLDCLRKLLQKGDIQLNKHTIIVLHKFLGVTFQ